VARALQARLVTAIVVAAVVFEAGAVAPASVMGGTGANRWSVPVGDHDSAEPKEPAAPTELVERRTADSETFDNHDGTFTTRVYSDTAYYQDDGSGAWLPVDVGFVAATDSAVKAASSKAPVTLGLRSSADPSGFLSLDDGRHPLSVALLGAVGDGDAIAAAPKDRDPTVADGIATYADVLPDVDLQVHPGTHGEKSFLVLKSPLAASAFAFTVSGAATSLRPAKDGSLEMVVADETVGHLPAPYLVDSSQADSGSGQFSDQVSLRLAKVGGVDAVVLAADPKWLASATYPVYVDPSVTFEDTSESFDAFVSAAYPTMNFGNYVRPDSPYYHEHWLGKDPSNASNVNEVFLKFDLSSIDDVSVDSAALEVYPYHQYYNAPTATDTWLNRVNGSWTEGGLTWNNKPGSTWVKTVGLVEGQTGSFSIKSTVQSWVDGSVTNNGVRLHENGNDATYWKRLISSEEGGSHVPALVVTYHRPTATPTSAGWTADRTLTWTYADSAGDAQSHKQVQVSTSSSFSSILSDSGVVASSTKSWTIPGGVSLTSGSEYYWRVKVKDGAGWSTWSDAKLVWDSTAPSGTIAIDNGLATTDTSTVSVVMNATDASTTAVYANAGRSLTSLVGCGSVTCNNSYPAPQLYPNKATGAIAAVANTGASPGWHTLTVDAGATNRPMLAMDVMRDSTADTYVGVVSDDNDGLRVELRASGGDTNLTSLKWTDTSTPQSYQTRTVDLPFIPGTWYRLVIATSGNAGSGSASLWWYARGTVQPASPTELVQGIYVLKPRLHAFIKGSASAPATLFLDNVEVAHTGTSAPFGSGVTGVRFSPDNTTWASWQGYADDLNYVLPAGAGTKTVYAQFRDAAGNVSSSVSDTITVAFGNLGRQPQHRLETWDLGAGDELAVNVETGNLVLTHPLVDLPYRGGNHLALAATHNAQATDNVGLGAGWQLDLQRRLVLNGDGTVTFVDADGARHTFTSPVTVGTVTTYTRPASLYATLVKDTAQGLEFTLTYRDQRLDRFDIAGSLARLASSEDRHGNALVLAYDGNGNLATATDPAARVVDFSWDTAPNPDRLTSVTDWAWIDGSGVVQTTATGSRRSYRFFYDGSGTLAGWSDPLNTTGACPTSASHLTCLSYSASQLTGIAKTQTYTTFSAGTLGTATRVITTAVTYAGSRVISVTDAESNTTTFVPDGSDRLVIRRPTTTTTYGFATTADPYARVTNVWRQLHALTELELRTTWDATYPLEPATVTDNYGALEGAPARTLAFTYQASSLGLLAKLVEPLTARRS
jgi:YD repeat-containing protein